MKSNKVSILKNTNRNRVIITTIVLVTFLAIIVGLGWGILKGGDMPLDESWKEILLLMLGAFIASYGKVIDFWFQNDLRDEKMYDALDEDLEKSECTHTAGCDCNK